MRPVALCALLSAYVLVVGGAAGGGQHVEVATPTSKPAANGVAEPAPHEVIVFAERLFSGESATFVVGDELPNLRETPAGNWDERISSLKVGADAIVVLYSWFEFRNVCLGLPGVNTGGSGRYSDLAKLKAHNPFHLDNRVKSLRVVAKGTDLRRICR